MAIAYGSMSHPIYQLITNQPNPFDKEPSSAGAYRCGGRHFENGSAGTVWESYDEAVLAIEAALDCLTLTLIPPKLTLSGVKLR